MMAGNPSWWSMQSELRSTRDHHNHEQGANSNLFISQTHPSNNNDDDSLLSINHHDQYLHGSSSTSSSSSLMPFISLVDHNHAQDFPHSWCQLLLGGMASEQEEERFISTTPTSHDFHSTRVINDVKQEISTLQSNNNNNLYGNQYNHEEEASSLGIISNRAPTPWTQLMPTSSPKSCVTTLSTKHNSNNNHNIDNDDTNIINNDNNMLDFSKNKRSIQADESHQHYPDHSNSECNSSANGGEPNKKPRIQSSSNPPLKVRKEKLGDRITSLHQLVSPFGKTDTASVLLETIGYIRFLQGQIEALNSPYLGSNNASIENPHSVHGERNCLFPDHPGQLLNAYCMKTRGAANHEDNKGATKDLKSRGLCLVPISCTQLVGNDNGADYWAQSLGTGF